MADAPEIRILRGNPTPEEEDAVRRAIVELWREEQARAARDAAANPWVLSGRVEGARQGQSPLRERARSKAWRLSGRIAAGPLSHITIGRGDAK